jgi:hypothetical protein
VDVSVQTTDLRDQQENHTKALAELVVLFSHGSLQPADKSLSGLVDQLYSLAREKDAMEKRSRYSNNQEAPEVNKRDTRQRPDWDSLMHRLSLLSPTKH